MNSGLKADHGSPRVPSINITLTFRYGTIAGAGCAGCSIYSFVSDSSSTTVLHMFSPVYWLANSAVCLGFRDFAGVDLLRFHLHAKQREREGHSRRKERVRACGNV